MDNKISDNLKTRSIRYIFFMTLIFCLVSCVLTKKTNEKNYYLHFTPPNVIKIGDNLYIDQTELSNLDWREYMYWTENVYTLKSKEFAAILPDTSVWNQYDSCLGTSLRNYLTQTEYEEYPVVGVSQKQAELYSKWRTDRVFENILQNYGKIKFDYRQSSKTHFTVEKYFEGKYQNTKPDTDFKYYPQYRIPTTNEYKMALDYADSVEQAYLQKCNSPLCKQNKLIWPEMQSDIIPCMSDTLFMIPTRKTHTGFVAEKRKPLYNLRGNVSEWTSDSGISIGGGWVHNKQRIMANDTFHAKTPNCWTGFRNVCEWKVYRNSTSK